MLTVIAGCVAWQSPDLPRPRGAGGRCSARGIVAQTQSALKWSDLTDEALRLTDAQAARTVAAVSAEGVLSTRVTLPGAEGAAFHSYAPFVLDEQGCPLMALTSQEATSNLLKDSSASFYARAPLGGAAAGSSLTLIGTIEEISVDEVDDASLNTLSKVTGTSVEEVAGRPWRRLKPSLVHLHDAVRSVESWVSLGDYTSAEPNPLAPMAASLLEKINNQHMDALRRFTAVYAGVPTDSLTEAQLLGVDQLGFDLQATLGPTAPSTVMRIGFRLPPANEEEGISVFMKLFQEAYEREHGFMK